MKKILLLTIILIIGLNNYLKSEPIYHGGVSFDFFYSSLSPYGEWIQMDNDLYAWRPFHNNRNWVPYTIGRWVWTAEGWYWDSYESFGWATYHYGRWYDDEYYGWIWIPDYDWAPAWVEWRYNDDYIGWAPLPPYATWSINLGVHFSINWTSPYHYWNFVHYKHFCGYDIHHHMINPKYRNSIYNNTRYRNDYNYNNGRIINRGIERDFVERRSGNRIAEREMIVTTNLRDNTGSRNRDEKRVEIYRPSESDINKARDIKRIEVRRDDRKTSLQVSKVEFKDRVKPDNKRVEIRTKESINEKQDGRNRIENTNEQRIENRVISGKRTENTSNNTNKVENKRGVSRIEKSSIENRNNSKREDRIETNNKPGNTTPRFEDRSSQKRNTDIRERKNTEQRKVETRNENSRDRSINKSDDRKNERGK